METGWLLRALLVPEDFEVKVLRKKEHRRPNALINLGGFTGEAFMGSVKFHVALWLSHTEQGMRN